MIFGLTMVPLFDDELLTSFISRLARANGRMRSRTFCLDMGLDPLRIERGDENEIASLANLIPIPLDRLLSRSVELGKNDGAHVAGAYFSKRSLLRRKLRFCPQCLAEDEADESRIPGTRRYYRTEWMIPALRSCPRHEATIVQSFEITYHNNAYDFTTLLDLAQDSMPEIVARSVPQPITGFELFVSDRIAGRFRHGSLLDDLSLSAAIDICELIGVGALFGRKYRSSSLGDADMLRAADHAYFNLKEGVSGLYALLDEMKSEISASNSRGGQAIYGRLYNALNEGHEGPDYDKIRKLIRDHTIATVPVLNGADFFGKIDDSPWTSVNVVCKATGISDQTVRRLLYGLGHLESHRPSKGEQFITRAGADEAIQILNDGVIRRDAAKILGCQEHVFSRLVDEGIFVPMQITRRSTAELDYLMFDRFSRAELLAFRQKLEDAVTVEVSNDMVSLSNVAKIQGEKQGTILDLVLTGKLKSVAMKKDGHLASRLMLKKSEVDAALWRPHGLTSDETAERLGIKRDTLRSLIDLKQFNPGKFGQHQRQLFDEEEVEAFRRRYITLGMLTKESGIPKGELLVRFRRTRASPAFPVEQVNVMLIPRDIADRMVVGPL